MLSRSILCQNPPFCSCDFCSPPPLYLPPSVFPPGKIELDPAITKKFLLYKIVPCFRDQKHTLYELWFDPVRPLPEQYLHCDPRCNPAQWRDLVHYFHSKAFQATSARNKAHREKLVMSHTTGTKPYARYHLHYSNIGMRSERCIQRDRSSIECICFGSLIHVEMGCSWMLHQRTG